MDRPCHIHWVDTLEWGTAGQTIRAGRWRRGPRWVGPPLAVWLALAGAVTAIAAEVLPWARTPVANRGFDLSLDSLSAVALLGYRLGWISLMGLTGLVLTARPPVRRAAAGTALGVGAALVMVLAGILRQVFASDSLEDLLVPGLGADGSESRASLGPGPGLFCACAAIILVLAAVVTAVRRRASLLVAAPTVPVAPLPGEPADLTVQPISSADERLFMRQEPN
jgi:hypothetical protein